MFTLMGGIAMFLYGMNLMGKKSLLEQTAKQCFENVLSTMTKASPSTDLLGTDDMGLGWGPLALGQSVRPSGQALRHGSARQKFSHRGSPRFAYSPENRRMSRETGV